MVIDNHHVDAARTGKRQRLVARGAAIDGNDEARALIDQERHGLGVGAIAFTEAVGNIDADVVSEGAEKALHERRGDGAVDVIVAEHGHGLAGDDGFGEACGRLVHVAQRGRVGHECLEARVEGLGGGLGRHTAGGEDAAEHLRQIVLLGDGGGEVGAPGREALIPGEPARRALDTKEWCTHGGGMRRPLPRA